MPLVILFQDCSSYDYSSKKNHGLYSYIENFKIFLSETTWLISISFGRNVPLVTCSKIVQAVIIIPPTYEVCGYSPDIQSMFIPPTYEECEGIIFSLFRSSVHSFIRTFVHSFVFLSQSQSFCVKVYKTSYFEDPLIDFIHIWHDGRYRSKVFISTIPTPGVTLGSRSQT